MSAAEPGERSSGTEPPHVLVAGDSTGVELADAIAEYSAAHPDQIRVSSAAFPGCGLTASDDGRQHAWNVGPEWIDISGCTTQWSTIPLRVRAESIDVVVVCIGPWDAGIIRFPDGTTVSVLDPAGRQLVAAAYTAFVAALSDVGAIPLFVTPATIDVEWERRDDSLDDPLRWDEIRAIVDSLGVPQIDLPGFLAANGVDGPPGRPDGVHLASEVLARFVAEVVVPQVDRAQPGATGLNASLRWARASSNQTTT